MFIALQILVAIGLILFPIVIHKLKGTYELIFFKGIVFGIHHDSTYFQVTPPGEEPKQFKLHTVSFHLLCMTLGMHWSVKTEFEAREE